MPAPLDDEARARLAGRRASHGVVIVVALVFIAASAGQIILAVFGIGIHPLALAAAGTPERACAEGIRAVARDLDHASEGSLTPVADACARSEHGNEAWASLLRLRRGQEQLGSGSVEDLEALRKDVRAHLPADLR